MIVLWSMVMLRGPPESARKYPLPPQRLLSMSANRLFRIAIASDCWLVSS
jgi:hypothetical protein